MAKYRYPAIGELAHQLRLSPARLRLRQLDAAEHLIDLIDSGNTYPYEFICHQITGYRPKDNTRKKGMMGKALIEDLVQFVEDLSMAPVVPVAIMPWACWTTEELAVRLRVSTKTICRWRRRGLAGRKLRYSDGTVRMAYLERSIRRFIVKNEDLVRRGAAFKQLTGSEKDQIVDFARSMLAERRMRLHELAQLVAARVGRAVETVRYTLRRYDLAHPEAALFGRDDQPVIRPELQAIHDAVKSGKTIEETAAAFGRPADTIKAILREVRARLMVANEIRYVHNQEFESPAADESILHGARDGDTVPVKRIRPPKDLPPYLQDLYRQPLFTPEQEREIFRRYNYLKCKADRLRRRLDPLEATDQELDQIDSLLTEAERVKNEILRANLRLVVSIARRHVGRAPCFFEIVSDGNLSLMRAVEKFDYARGFKFSTYASWAIMRNYARTIPEQMYQAAKLVTGTEETLAAAPAQSESARESIIEAARHMVQKGLGLLSDRERDIITWHYGLDRERSPMTLDQIGRLFGVTKERVRQIERKAFAKLRESLAIPGAELAQQAS